ncbi:MAG: Cu(I)-responsive transcriptional regulator [Deltaproteobacteria bacterium]|nr:MAG: Cu(I)-responsive transcriptional regulator [Deltaproteobacteria bacterium]
MSIGEVAAASGVSTKAIRYYESIGLVPPAERLDNGYRVYRRQALEELRFIRRARGLGFPLEEVEALLALWRDKHRASAEVKALAQRQIAAIDAKLEELRSMRDVLRDLVTCCHGDDRPDCPILNRLADEE